MRQFDAAGGTFLQALQVQLLSTCSMIQSWQQWDVHQHHRLPSKVVDAPSLEALKARLDGALSNLV